MCKPKKQLIVLVSNKLFCILSFLIFLGNTASAQHYYKSTARQLEQIDTVFPYDVQLLKSNGTLDTSLTSSDLVLSAKSKTVLVFWLTTCRPCAAELAEIANRFEAWKSHYTFNFVPISIDFPKRRGDFHERAASYPWPSYLDVDREFPLVMPGNLNGVPQIFVFDETGKQVFHRRKYRPGDLEALEKVLAN